jgi:DNA-directed RNA polymerase subunit RPC12/RpoP
MPKCAICGKTIRANQPRSYATLNGRKRYACSGCTEAFDKLIDAHCPACGSEEWYENRSDGFVWMECDACGEKQVLQSPPG